jgi:hypothetical protein
MKSVIKFKNAAEMLRRYTASLSVIMLLSGTVAYFSALADRALIPLGELVAASDLIIVGTVSAVEEKQRSGVQKATIRIDKSLRGVSPPKLELHGNRLDPGLPQFYPKTSIIAFLAKKDNVFIPVGGDHGVIQLSPDMKQVTQRIVQQVTKLGKGLKLDDIQYALKSSSPVLPIVLEGSLLEELSLRATKQDAKLIDDIACSPSGNYRDTVQHWAIHRIGMLKLAQSQSCLERLTRISEPRDVRILAVEALGNLGNKDALKTLLPMLPKPGPSQTLPASPSKDEDDSLLHKNLPVDKDGDSKTDRYIDPEKVPVNASDKLESAVPKPTPSEDTQVPAVKAPITSRSHFDRGLADTVLLAIGKIGSEQAISRLETIALSSNEPSLSSTAVHALGLIGTPRAYDSLSAINKTSRDALLRDQVLRTMKRLRK